MKLIYDCGAEAKGHKSQLSEIQRPQAFSCKTATGCRVKRLDPKMLRMPNLVDCFVLGLRCNMGFVLFADLPLRLGCFS